MVVGKLAHQQCCGFDQDQRCRRGVTVRNSVGLAVNSAVKGQANGAFLDASSPARLDVENNYVENPGGGVWCTATPAIGTDNRPRDPCQPGAQPEWPAQRWQRGYFPGVGSNRSVSNFIQLDKVQAVPGVDVGWNEVINYPGHSLVADNINVKS